MAVTGWFGWSVLWLMPLLWRLAKAFLFKRAPLQGQGYIRLWLGTFLMLCASSALEAFIRKDEDIASDSVVFGQWVGGVVADTFGMAFGVLLLVATMVVTMPWLFGGGALGLIRWVFRAGAAQPERRGEGAARTPVSIAPERTAGASPIRAARMNGGAQPAAKESWKLPAPYFGKDAVKKTAEPVAVRNEKNAPGARSSEEWAPFESIRPTSAMLARAKAVDAENARKQQREPVRIVATPPKPVAQAPRRTVQPVQSKADKISKPEPRTVSAPVPVAVELPPQPAAEPVIQSAIPQVHTAAPAAFEDAAVIQAVPQVTIPEPAVADEEPAQVDAQVAEQDAPVFQETSAVEIQAQVVEDAPVPLDVEEVRPAEPSSMPQEMPIVRQAAPADVAPRVPMGEPFAFQAPSEVNVDLPGLDLLDNHADDLVEISATELAETGQLIEQRLKEFKVPATVLGASAGPVITRFEIEPAVGVRGAQIVGLMKDLSRALGLTSIRVVETIPGKTCMGLELPNTRRQMIQLSEMLASDAYRASRSHLTLAMGKDITGAPVVTDLARAPHMLVAGTTGSGKSVAINAMILSLLYKSTPADVRLIMIDPKMLELSVYDGIPHLLAPVVTDMKLAANALTWCVAEMEKRYRLMSALGVRNLAGFNQKIRDGKASGRYVTNPFSLTPDAPEPLSTLSTIVVVIDELADLMMVAGKKIEELIARLAQKARAAGIHLILATQRPSVDVITGLIKANIPTRVAFQVSSKIDSRTVLDQMGAETLLGHGDMLFLPPGSGYPQRVHGAFVSDEEVHRVVEYLKQFGEPEYEEAILAGAPSEEASGDLFGDAGGAEADPLYDEAVAFVIRTRRASISAVQRQLRIGYNRAARLVEQMETAGIVSPMSANGSRDILVPASSG